MISVVRGSSRVIPCRGQVPTGDNPMTGGAIMAKKVAGKGKPDPDQMVTRALKMRQEYADWLERFATRERVNLSSLIDRALSAHAQQVSFESPPERIP